MMDPTSPVPILDHFIRLLELITLLLVVIVFKSMFPTWVQFQVRWKHLRKRWDDMNSSVEDGTTRYIHSPHWGLGFRRQDFDVPGTSRPSIANPLSIPRLDIDTTDELHNDLEGSDISDYCEQPTSASLDETTSSEGDETSPSEEICVLSLDGGGCRGLLSLHILRNLLRRVEGLQPGERRKIHPHEYFHLLCGTSTGGLIAILLGVLHLDIDTAIDHYEKLAEEVFTKNPSIGRRAVSMGRYLWTDARHSRKRLESAIDKILKENGAVGKPIMDEDPDKDKGSRTFVTTTYCDGIVRDVILVRSYVAPEGEQKKDYDQSWTVKNAALATAVAPTYFNRLAIVEGDTESSFEDAGAHGANNPTKLAWKESQKLPDLKNRTSMFISIGTGRAPSQPTSGFFGLCKNKIETLNAWIRLGTDVHNVHKQMKRKAEKSQDLLYYRFNPTLKEKIGLAASGKLSTLKRIAEDYCKKHDGELDKCAEMIMEFRRLHKAT